MLYLYHSNGKFHCKEVEHLNPNLSYLEIQWSEPQTIEIHQGEREVLVLTNCQFGPQLNEISGWIKQHRGKIEDLLKVLQLLQQKSGQPPLFYTIKSTAMFDENYLNIRKQVVDWVQTEKQKGYSSVAFVNKQKFEISPEDACPRTHVRVYCETKQEGKLIISKFSRRKPNLKDWGYYRSYDFKQGSPTNYAIPLSQERGYLILKQVPLTWNECERFVHWVQRECQETWEDELHRFISIWTQKAPIYSSELTGALLLTPLQTLA